MTAPTPRILSIDIFRGLTMLVMIFVNDLAGVEGLPWWTYHMPRGVSGMTYVDVVFPAFLFILGMTIPLSVERRLQQDGSQWKLWRHILLRFAALAILGIFIANGSKVDPILTGVSAHAWSLIGFVGAILLWNVYAKDSGTRTVLLKCTGFAMLFTMLAIFRRTATGGQAAWLDFSYWEILGLIARAYLAVCILYMPLRKWRWAPLALLTLLCALNVASRLGLAPLLRPLPYWVWPFGRGDTASITMAGIVASQIFLTTSFAKTFRQRAAWATGYAAALAGAGWLFVGFGVAKNAGTPSWCLWSSAISVVLFLGLYWVVDVKGRAAWARFARPAGANTLLTYLLPDIFYAAFGLSYAPVWLNSGLPGVARSLAFTAVMLSAAALLTRWRVRMQL
ncbi:MAG TPA: DUF5009 domain-containing protein [Paludibaculum sp.]